VAGPGAALRRLLERPGIVVAPGAFNALSASLVAQAGFEAVYCSGAGIANMLLGRPDVGLVTMTEMVQQIRYMAAATSVPIIADADTGYGNPINVTRTVQEYEAAGVAAIQLEDQSFPKRCGHFEGKQVIGTAEMVAKIRAACDARRDPDTLIIARTDARAVLGLEAAVERAQLYTQAGAEMIFLEAPTSVAELQQVGALGGWQMANMVENGKTPLLTADELSSLGFKLVIFPNTAMRAALKAMEQTLAQLMTDRTSSGMLDRLASMADRNRVTGMDRIQEIERRYAHQGE